MIDVLERAIRAGELTELDAHFSRWLVSRWGGGDGGLMLAAALLSRQAREGHVCVELSQWASDAVFRERDGSAIAVAPSLSAWIEALRRSPTVGQAGEWAPMILEGTRLYLARLWFHEQRLASALVERAEAWADNVDGERLLHGLQRLFPADRGGTDWQRIAACLAVLKKFLVISGGPGTGKTRTVTSIMSLVLEQTPTARIALAAPTGKAAARLRDSVIRARSELRLGQGCVDLLPDTASTIHRLLGARPGRARFMHHAGNPLPIDMLVVDEASMVDLPLMAKLIDALPPAARLLLLGDKDQLASVEAGSVMGDLCEGADDGLGREACARLTAFAGESLVPSSGRRALSDNVVLLRRSYRFQSDSGIGALAQAVNAGEDGRVIEILTDPGTPGIHWCPPGRDGLQAALGERVVPFVQSYVSAVEPLKALARFQELRVLCVLRDGPCGVSGINASIETLLARSGVLVPEAGNYRGKPIMLTSNAPGLGVYNGDVALLWPETAAGASISACFPTADGDVRAIAPGRLPAHETAYAMTVHKSQGSECDDVLIVLPERDVRVLSRELLYTAITRARHSVAIWGDESLLRRAVRRRGVRGSGLSHRLRTLP